mmetsp:Transcript_2161/g.4719  ORF Transcript_2161/g.4719 Transcript_2161/m.4719 type:complete len:337 (-) Transcript_2161:262-1272(-)|eukprot:CAMPEP_0172552092 /NCGR_PEP_ID=MMETSP1067-20121228/43621_1 /TAXON_ID=265564 ORGANISM="Thalassiosira punctigera, Strain Tpunct2005C2" /NCGR_SAMPLE_ID=MMETSP1067 /ASSEMBLY_ACC=CAM_ASM_000444 /LENGTH=336 /DNA_ID=CAMNT_0013340009 /DNA_START=105 /DNA_END=1115 /DNA_ORIENTATION=-
MGVMMAIQYSENKSGDDFVDVLKMASVPAPKASPGLAIVKVVAAASNPIDYKVLGGHLKAAGWAMPLPFTVGYDFSGTICEVDEADAPEWPVGKEVFGVQWGRGKHDEGDMPVGGAFAEYVAVPVSRLSAKPAGISHEAAAACALVGTTARQIVNDCAEVKKGDRVLILGGPTSVGMISVQLALRNGAEVITTASPRNTDFVNTLADGISIINYRAEKWWESAVAKDVDSVIDTTGEEGGWEHAQKILKAKGNFVSINSFDVGFDPKGHAPRKFASFYALSNDPGAQDEIAAALASGGIKMPLVEPAYPFSEQGAKDMLSAQARGSHTGKLVMKIG